MGGKALLARNKTVPRFTAPQDSFIVVRTRLETHLRACFEAPRDRPPPSHPLAAPSVSGGRLASSALHSSAREIIGPGLARIQVATWASGGGRDFVINLLL